MSIEEISRFFEPESVAVVGASRKPDKFGSVILQNLLTLGYPGRLYAVNRNAAEIQGVRSFPSVAAIKERVDAVIVSVPANQVPQVLKDCQQNGARNVTIISAGFSEAGEPGQKLLAEVLSIARSGHIRIVGPNTTGILNPSARFTTTFMPLVKDVRNGSVAFIAQTGMFAGVMVYHIITTQHFGISKVAGLGNKVDVDETDILEYLLQDKATRAVMVYMEGLRDPRRFLSAARTFVQDKPIVVLKGGRTPAGAKAALSHTGSLAVNSSLVTGLFKQAGVIVATELEEMIDCAKILNCESLPQGNRVGIASMSGGAMVMASDAVTEAGLVVGSLSQARLAALQKLVPEWAIASHPIDLEPLSEIVGRYESHRVGLEALLDEPGIDMGLVVTMLVGGQAEEEGLVNALAPALSTRRKPVVIVLLGPKAQCETLAARFEGMGVPTYAMVSNAARSLAALRQYATIRRI
ncbi:MAG: CoA-binding protein [Chloroflexi bacterium]|nr:CoA-binding protein [Chloroflexota bacterium]